MGIGSTHALKGKFECEAMSVVCCQFGPVSCQTIEEVDRNVDTIIGFMDRAAMGFPGFDLFVSAECALQGAGPDWPKVMIKLDGPQVTRLREKCAELGVWGVFDPWIDEYKGHKAVNLGIIVNDKGEIVSEFIKNNPWTPGEITWPGTGAHVVDGPCGSKLGIIICADGDYPEIWREVAVNGANVIIRIAHYMAPYDKAWEITNKAGAYFNQSYVVAANSVGMDEYYTFFGRSMILGPDGNIIAEAPIGIPWLLKADIYPAMVDNLREKAGSHSLLYQYNHRGASHVDTQGKGLDLSAYKAYN